LRDGTCYEACAGSSYTATERHCSFGDGVVARRDVKEDDTARSLRLRGRRNLEDAIAGLDGLRRGVRLQRVRDILGHVIMNFLIHCGEVGCHGSMLL